MYSFIIIHASTLWVALLNFFRYYLFLEELVLKVLNFVIPSDNYGKTLSSTSHRTSMDATTQLLIWKTLWTSILLKKLVLCLSGPTNLETLNFQMCILSRHEVHSTKSASQVSADEFMVQEQVHQWWTTISNFILSPRMLNLP